MIDEDNLIKNKLFDMANKAYSRGIPLNSHFLNLHEQEIFNIHKKSLEFSHPILFGGHELCERKCVFFNDEHFWNLVCLKISPQNEKYAEKLHHKDFLGAIMNLGVDNSMIGDLFVLDNVGYLFCLKSISDFFVQNLLSVKRTKVFVEIVNVSEVLVFKKFKTLVFYVESSRIDLIVSRMYHLSRSEGQVLAKSGDVFVNDVACKNQSLELKEGDIVSVRHKGKFRVDKIEKVDFKNKVVLKIYS